MPIYENRCQTCNHEFDNLGKYEDNALLCPRCQSTATTRLMSTPCIPVTALARGSSATPDSVDRWDKMRQQKMAIEQQKLADHGTYE